MFKQLHELKNDTLGKKKTPSLLKTPFHIALAEVTFSFISTFIYIYIFLIRSKQE